MVLDRDSATPLHTQLEQMMRQKMASNEWAVGKLIPSENKISQQYGISRMTVRNVITKLEQEGLVERVMGKGTYVSSPKMQGGNLKFDGIISQLQKKGYTITTRVLSIEKVVNSKLAGTFSLPADCVYYEVKRLRYMNDSPMSVHVTYIPAFFVPDLESKKEDMEKQQLFIILERSYGLFRGTVCETWHAAKAPRWITDTLQIKPSQPILMDFSVTHNAAGNVYYSETEYFRGDKISLYFEFQ